MGLRADIADLRETAESARPSLYRDGYLVCMEEVESILDEYEIQDYDTMWWQETPDA